MLPPVPLLLLGQPQPPHLRLNVEHAWALALTWNEPLANKVCLMKTGDARDDISEGYGWIHFSMWLAKRSEVSAARATALIWFALSCCPGYAGHENPVFWKCLLSELRESRPRYTVHLPRKFSTITDAFTFFDSDAGIDFPRFCVSVRTFHDNVRLFCGLAGEELEAVDEAKLQQVMDALQPWIDPKRTSRRPEVILMQLRECHFDATCASTAPYDQDPVHAEFTRFLDDATASSTTELSWPRPSFAVKDVTFSGTLVPTDTAFVDKFVQTLQKYDLVMTHLNFIENPVWSSERPSGYQPIPADQQHAAREALATVVRHVLGLPGVSTRTRVTVLRLQNYAVLCAPAYLSALPFTTTTEEIEFDYASHHRFEEQYMVWLAYALFHPDTSTSTWRSLALVTRTFGYHGVRVLEAMAKGNNLTAFANDQLPISDGYYQATLVQGATVLDRPVLEAADTYVAAVLATSDGTMIVDVCGVASTDPHEWDDWVQVIVPAYGLAWVSSVNVASVEKRAPSPVSLTRLRISDYSQGYANELATALKVLGRRLTHLDLRRCSRTRTMSDTLRRTLAACTSLESLMLYDDGGLWNGELLLPLRELVIKLPPSSRLDNQLDSIVLPRTLERLRIDARGSPPAFQINTAAVQHMLTQYQDNVRLFHWHEGLSIPDWSMSYSSLCEDSTNRLAELGLPPQVARLRLPASRVAAFLSVLSHRESWSTMDQEVTKIIVGFAGESVDRVVVLEPEEQPRGRRGHTRGAR